MFTLFLPFWGFTPRSIVLLVALTWLLAPINILAQSSVSQTFSSMAATSGELAFTSSGTGGGMFGYFSTTGGANTTGAYGVAKTNSGADVATTTLTFATKTFAINSGTAASPNKLTFQLANPVSTFSDASRIDVSISVNGGAFTPQLSITAPSSGGPTFRFDSPSASYTSTYSATAATTAMGSNSYINMVTINLPSSTTARTQIGVQIMLSAGNRGKNSQNTILIDNVTLSSGNTASPLPIELTRFDATAKVNAVRVSWATAQEKNNDHFDVQRSATGKDFQTIGTVQGQGTSTSAHEYLFSDSRPLTGRSYYRLRQIDTDGVGTFSPVVTVHIQSTIAVYPNPSAGTIQLPATMGTMYYRILNPLGQSLLNGQIAGNEQLDLTALPKGVLLLELTGETGRSTQRLIHE